MFVKHKHTEKKTGVCWVGNWKNFWLHRVLVPPRVQNNIKKKFLLHFIYDCDSIYYSSIYPPPDSLS